MTYNHVTLSPRLSRFSWNVEKLGGAWGRGYSKILMRSTVFRPYKNHRLHLRDFILVFFTILNPIDPMASVPNLSNYQVKGVLQEHVKRSYIQCGITRHCLYMYTLYIYTNCMYMCTSHCLH